MAALDFRCLLTMCGGGILTKSLVGLALIAFGFTFPDWAMLSATGIGMVAGLTTGILARRADKAGEDACWSGWEVGDHGGPDTREGQRNHV